MPATITISLLDPIRGDAVQSWVFDNATVIRFGRAPTNDVEIADSQVSRLHGELIRNGDNWSVTSLGQNGIAIGGRAITGPMPVAHETVLRLAASGPYLEFRFGRRQNTSAERLADQRRWAEREQDQSFASRTDVTEVDLLKRLPPRKPAD